MVNSTPKPLWRTSLALFLTIGLLLISPVVAIVLFEFWILRKCVSYLAKWFRPDLGSLMSLASAAFASDLIYSHRTPKVPLILAISLKGRLDIGELRRAVTRLINRRNDKGIHEFPELQQSVTTWFDLIFWKWEPNFKVEDHVNIYKKYAKETTFSEEKLLELTNDLLGQRFAKDKSPWEFLVLHNYRSGSSGLELNQPQTLVILRTHHCLGDGFSLLKLFLVDMSGETLHVAQAAPYQMKMLTSNIHPCRKVVQALCFPFRIAHELMTEVVFAWDINDWHIPEWKLRRRINGGVSPPIPLEFVKKIKNAHGISFAAVPLAAFTGGIRNFMIERSLPLPDAIHCLTALPYPNHPWKLTNHLTGCFIKLPLGLPTARERLLSIENNLLEVKRSTVPTTLFYLMQIAGLPFAFISFLFLRNLLTTALNSNFPGPDVETKFAGLSIQDTGFSAGLGSGNTVIGLGSLSYNGSIRLMAAFDEAVLPANVSFKDLMARIVQELKNLDAVAPSKILQINPQDVNGNVPPVPVPSKRVVKKIESKFKRF